MRSRRVVAVGIAIIATLTACSPASSTHVTQGTITGVVLQNDDRCQLQIKPDGSRRTQQAVTGITPSYCTVDLTGRPYQITSNQTRTTIKVAVKETGTGQIVYLSALNRTEDQYCNVVVTLTDKTHKVTTGPYSHVQCDRYRAHPDLLVNFPLGYRFDESTPFHVFSLTS